MGFLDSAQDLLSRGVAATERGTRTLSLKTQLTDANRQRERALAALGESVYAATRDDMAFRVGREELYRAVEEADALRESIEGQIADVEAQSAAARAQAAGSRPCPNCGATVAAEHRFCASCGTPVPPLASEAPVAEAASASTREPTCEACAEVDYDVEGGGASVQEIAPENITTVDEK